MPSGHLLSNNFIPSSYDWSIEDLNSSLMLETYTAILSEVTPRFCKLNLNHICHIIVDSNTHQHNTV